MATAAGKRPGRPSKDAIRIRREDEILDAAVKLFAQRGYSDANTQELADRLGVGKGTIYRYFPTKRDLFLAAVDRVIRGLIEAIDAAAESADDPLHRMANAVKAYLGYFAEHPEFVELLILERAQFKDRQKPTYFVYKDANAERRREAFRQLIAEGRIRQMSVDRIIEVLSDLLYGTMFTNYFAGRNRSPEEQAKDILDVVFHGILSESERHAGQAAEHRHPSLALQASPKHESRRSAAERKGP